MSFSRDPSDAKFENIGNTTGAAKEKKRLQIQRDRMENGREATLATLTSLAALEGKQDQNKELPGLIRRNRNRRFFSGLSTDGLPLGPNLRVLCHT